MLEIMVEEKLVLAPPSSLLVTETVNGSRAIRWQMRWESGNTSQASHSPSGKYQWAVYGKNSTYVSVLIALASDGTDVRALFKLTLIDQSGKEKHKVHGNFDRSLESAPYTLKHRGSVWGYKHFFFRRAALEMSDFLKDDCLKINCIVGVVIRIL